MIILFSDSHGNSTNMRLVMDRLGKSAQYVIFMGDGIEDFSCLIKDFPEPEYIAVSGNCDFCSDGELQRIVNIEGFKFLISHGHRHGVKTSLAGLKKAALDVGANVCLFGHTHMQLVKSEHGILFMNPGSITKPRVGEPSFGVINIKDGVITASTLSVDDI